MTENGTAIEFGVRFTDATGTTHTVVASTTDSSMEASRDLTYEKALLVTERIATALDVTDRLIVQAYSGRAWKALGFGSWDSWVDAQFGDRPLLQVPRDDRAVTVRSLKSEGLSNRMIGRIIGLNERTVRRELGSSGAANAAPGPRDGLGLSSIEESVDARRPAESDFADASYDAPDGGDDEAISPAEPRPIAPRVTGRDGKSYPAKRKIAPPLPRGDDVARELECDICGDEHGVDCCPFAVEAELGSRNPRAWTPPAEDEDEVEDEDIVYRRPTGWRGSQSVAFDDEADQPARLAEAVRSSIRSVESQVVGGILGLAASVRMVASNVREWAGSDTTASDHTDPALVQALQRIVEQLQRVATDLPDIIGDIGDAIAVLGEGDARAAGFGP